MNGKFTVLYNDSPVVFTEGAVIERLRRETNFPLDPHIAHAAFIYSPEKRAALKAIYREYIDAVRPSGLPLILLTPTWRASADRLLLAAMSKRDVNRDNVSFMQGIRKEAGQYSERILLGGLIGCRGDAYKPSDALPATESAFYHAFQVNALAASGVDFLCAATLPAITEAIGVARVMARTTLPYILSFVLRRTGALLDGTSMADAIDVIDSSVPRKPAGYWVNCTHPTVLQGLLQNAGGVVRERLIGIQANTSSKSPEELDGAAFLDTEDPEVFASLMLGLYRSFGIRILGGCCGTDAWHIRALVSEAAQKGVAMNPRKGIEG
jgi:homocysteine S-methyltransferase